MINYLSSCLLLQNVAVIVLLGAAFADAWGGWGGGGYGGGGWGWGRKRRSSEGTAPNKKVDQVIYPQFEEMKFFEYPTNARFKRTAQPWGGWGGGWGWGK